MAKLESILGQVGTAIDAYAEGDADRAAASLPPLPAQRGPGLEIDFGPEDRTAAEHSARFNFPFYFASATDAEAEALIATVSAQCRYVVVVNFPRHIPECRRELEIECNKWEQRFLENRDRVRASATFARLTDAQRQRIEDIAFLFPEADPEPEDDD